MAGNNSSSTGSRATVLEYICLFTHDLIRKQKRWQDGRLKFHDFNKRIMVYDERGNYIGDTHWQHDWSFGEDEEFQVERGGVLVQVGACVNRQTQDLSELLDKRLEEREQRHAKALARSTALTPARTPSSALLTQQRTICNGLAPHRQLLSVIGTPTGHPGRALVSNESPFQQRQQGTTDSGDAADRRPAKRPRFESPSSKLGFAQSLFGAKLTLSGLSTSSAPLRPPSLLQRRPPAPSSSPPLLPREPGPRPKPVEQMKDVPCQKTRPARQECEAAGELTDARDSSTLSKNRTDPSNSSQQRKLKEIRAAREGMTTDKVAQDQDINHSGAPKPRVKKPATGSSRVAAPPSLGSRLGEAMVIDDERLKDKTETRNVEMVQQVQPEEPRVELKVKSRQKRGLMMVSDRPNTTKKKTRRELMTIHSVLEQSVTPEARLDERQASNPFASSPPSFNAVPWQNDPSSGQHFRSHGGFNGKGEIDDLNCGADVQLSVSSHQESKPPAMSVNINMEDTVHGINAVPAPPIRSERESDLSPKTSPRTRRLARPATQSRAVGHRAVEEKRAVTDAPDTPRQDILDMNAHRRDCPESAPRPPSDRDSSNDDMPLVPVGPRLAKLGSKSVKSSEVIGRVLNEQELANLIRRAYGRPDTVLDELNGSKPRSEQDKGTTTDVMLKADASLGACWDAPDALSIHSAPSQPSCRLASATSLRREDSASVHKYQFDAGQGKLSDDAMTGPTEQPVFRKQRGLDRQRHESACATPQLGRVSGNNSDKKSRIEKPRAAAAPGQREMPPADELHDNDKAVESKPRAAAEVGASVAASGAVYMAVQGEGAALDGDCAAANVESANPRITNPATRGRKAALSSDAAGQIPEPILLPDFCLVSRVNIRVTDVTRARSIPVIRDLPRSRTVSFPGFTTASALGPWSREAYDLLDCAQPTKR